MAGFLQGIYSEGMTGGNRAVSMTTKIGIKLKNIFTCILALYVLSARAQDSITVTPVEINKPDLSRHEDHSLYPYKTSFKKDAPFIATGLGLSTVGLLLIQKKEDLTVAELESRTRDKVPSFDRGNAGFYSDRINKESYIPFNASFAMPIAMLLFNKNERRNASSVLVMYTESLALTSTVFTLTAGLVHRSRPLVYTPSNAPDEVRKKAVHQRSFFAGHTAASATATFFTAKVFSDLNPGSPLKPVVWGIAAAVPAVVGYMRYKSGFHFLSDNVVGYLVGAASGILVPAWHKRHYNSPLSIVPFMGNGTSGVSLFYKMK